MTKDHPRPDIILPHSYPFLLIDRILKREKLKCAVCLKNVSFNEEFFKGHFSSVPIMPGALIIEAMAQTSGLVLDCEENSRAFLTKIDSARFTKPVVPGDVLIIKSELAHKLHPMYVFRAAASVNDNIVAEAEVTLSIV